MPRKIFYPFHAHCCYMGTAMKHPLPDQVKPPSFVIFDIWALWRLSILSRIVQTAVYLYVAGEVTCVLQCLTDSFEQNKQYALDILSSVPPQHLPLDVRLLFDVRSLISTLLLLWQLCIIIIIGWWPGLALVRWSRSM